MENKRMTRQELINLVDDKESYTIRNVDFIGEDLSDLIFDNIGFSECKFVRCRFGNTDFVHSLLNQVSFQLCSFVGTNFSLCHIRNIFVNRCEFTDVKFIKANLCHGGFNYTELFNCDMTESTQYDLSFNNCDIENICHELAHISDQFYDRCNILHTNYSDSSIFCHVVMDDCRLDGVNTEGLDDELICYGPPIDEIDDKEMVIHINVKGKKAEVTLVEEV